ncbi:MAG TPA: hypothetical protein VK835_02595 [Bacteroidia bacterium]|nr:hypothetical protein [Bacteroidia bacterium]
MKKSVFMLSIFITCLAFCGCKKTDVTTTAYGTSKNYSSVASALTNTGGAFSFTKITLSPNPVKIGVASKLFATASGNNLTYKWSTSHGDLFGTGAAIYYSDSCIGTYTITCVVSDGVHSATITIPITVSS